MSSDIRDNTRWRKPDPYPSVASVDMDEFYNAIMQARTETRQPSKLSPVDESFFKKYPVSMQTKNKIEIKIIGAAKDATGVEIKKSDLKIMSDPYKNDVRTEFTDIAYTDPTVSYALEQRTDALFEDGYTLEIELKSRQDADTKKTIDPQTEEKKLDEMRTKFGNELQQIRDWDKLENIKTLEKMKTVHIASLVQGRSLILIQPPISELPAGSLPEALKVVATEDIQEPIVDTGEIWKLVAVKLALKSKEFAMADEIIYVTRKNWGLRKDSLYYGASILEPILTASKAYRRIINYDLPKAVISAYIQKLIIQLETRGSPKQQKDQLTDYAKTLMSKSNDIVVANLASQIQHASPTVNNEVLELAKSIYEDILISGAGATKSMMGRDHSLTRDIATIQAILFVKYRRKPDEKLIASAFENQLYNPLLAHLTGTSVEELPVKIVVKRITNPNEEMEATDTQNRSEKTDGTSADEDTLGKKKVEEIESDKLKQENVIEELVGATREDLALKKKLTALIEEDIRSNESKGKTGSS